MLHKILLALISIIRLWGRIGTTPARAAYAALREDVTLRNFWLNLATENPWLRSILSSRRMRAYVPVLSRIPREHYGWHPPLPAREITFLHPRLK
ncbi:hypothetical protein CA54_56350 [Symmachiella macrocystis]|uniref:Uncharacterized protein n=1 Tax=Symmachiella macrocystis TaxID=2527985 RepID=A0A5C6B5K6_9PLAN|nr:hypothetical protein [Symmachiella macrocystis]TWU07230.1 hypothetical protein CA54_56350 [Symmachiella macrocystis]